MDPNYQTHLDSRFLNTHLRRYGYEKTLKWIKEVYGYDPNHPASYEKLKDLGQGVSRVIKVKFNPTGAEYACKCYELPENEESCQKVKGSLDCEVRLLQLYTGLDIFPDFHGSFEVWDDVQNRYTFNIVIAPVADGDLGRELRSIMVQFDPRKPPPQPDVPKIRRFRYLSRFWLAELSQVIFYLHGIGTDATDFVRHRDIKLENFLIITLPNPKYDNASILELEESDPPIKQIILSDFGISKVFPSITQAITNSIQPEKNFFSAPEVLCDGSPHGIKCDVFSLGAIMFEILVVMWNVPDLVNHTKTWGSGTAYGSKTLDQHSTFPPSLADPIWLQGLDEQERKYFPRVLAIIKELLHRDPDKRPSATDICGSFRALELEMGDGWKHEMRRYNDFELFAQRNGWVERMGDLDGWRPIMQYLEKNGKGNSVEFRETSLPLRPGPSAGE